MSFMKGEFQLVISNFDFTPFEYFELGLKSWDKASHIATIPLHTAAQNVILFGN